jgi:hypothetical protein
MSQGPYIIADSYSQFERHGHPGKYVHPIKVTNATVEFTGSLYGYGAILVQNNTGLEVTASNGVGIPGAAFTTGIVHEVGIRRIKAGASGIVYVFRRQQ